MSETQYVSRENAFLILDKYPIEAIEKAFVDLGYDPQSETFPTSIVEDVLGMVDSVYLAQERVLSESAPNTEKAILLQETTAMAGDILHSQNFKFNPQTLAAVAQLFVLGGSQDAKALFSSYQKSFTRTFQAEQRVFESSLVKAVAEQRKSMANLLSPENIEKMLAKTIDYSDQEPFDAEGFVSEVREQIKAASNLTTENKKSVKALEASKEDFDVDALLDKLWGEE